MAQERGVLRRLAGRSALRMAFRIRVLVTRLLILFLVGQGFRVVPLIVLLENVRVKDVAHIKLFTGIGEIEHSGGVV